MKHMSNLVIKNLTANYTFLEDCIFNFACIALSMENTYHKVYRYMLCGKKRWQWTEEWLARSTVNIISS